MQLQTERQERKTELFIYMQLLAVIN